MALDILIFKKLLYKYSASFSSHSRSHGGHTESITPVFQHVRLWANTFNSFQFVPMIFHSRVTVLLHVSRGLPGSLLALIKGFHSIAFLAIHFFFAQGVTFLASHTKIHRLSVEAPYVNLSTASICSPPTWTNPFAFRVKLRILVLRQRRIDT